MVVSVPGQGSQYIGAYQDSAGNWLTGDHTYKIQLPKDVPANMFWSLTVYDNDTRSMIRNKNGRPLVGSVHGAVANEDGSFASTSVPSSRRMCRKPTGCRPRLARDGSSTCGSTAPSNHISTRHGSRAISRWWRSSEGGHARVIFGILAGLSNLLGWHTVSRSERFVGRWFFGSGGFAVAAGMVRQPRHRASPRVRRRRELRLHGARHRGHRRDRESGLPKGATDHNLTTSTRFANQVVRL
jgi:hypothetical protein